MALWSIIIAYKLDPNCINLFGIFFPKKESELLKVSPSMMLYPRLQSQKLYLNVLTPPIEMRKSHVVNDILS